MLYATACLRNKMTIEGVDYDLCRRSGSDPRKGETLAQYGKRLATEAEKNIDYFFARVSIDLLPEDVTVWENAVLRPILMEIYRWTQNKAIHYVNPTALTPRPYGSDYLGLIARGESGGLRRGRPFEHHS